MEEENVKKHMKNDLFNTKIKKMKNQTNLGIQNI